MDTLLHHLALANFGLQPWMISIIVPVAGMLVGVIFGIGGMYFHHRKQEMWHQTARVALEKGQPLPPLGEFGETGKPAEPMPRWRGLMIGGLINLGVGGGLYVALGAIPNTAFNLGLFGCIPLFIGVALILGAIIEAIAARKP